MKQVYKIGSDGFYIEPVLLKPNEEIPSDCVEKFPTEGLFKAKWNGTSWEEGLAQVEIEELINRPVPVDPLTALGKQLTQEKLKNIQLNSQVNSMGQQLTLLKLDVMKLKGGQFA